jgi:hypothetical protein
LGLQTKTKDNVILCKRSAGKPRVVTQTGWDGVDRIFVSSSDMGNANSEYIDSGARCVLPLRESAMKPVGKPDAGIRLSGLMSGGWETGWP